MSDDLVKRLRAGAMTAANCLCGNPVCHEAADEIERLRAVVQQAYCLLDNGADHEDVKDVLFNALSTIHGPSKGEKP